MSMLERLAWRIQHLRGDALLVEGVLLLAGLGFLVAVNLATDTGWYAIAWAIVLLLTLVAPDLAHALLPLGLMTWWLGGAPVGSAYSLPAAWCLLAVFTCLALLTASPDGMRLSRVVVRRYLQRALVVGALTALAWVPTVLLHDVRGTSVLTTTAGFAALAAVLVVLPRLLPSSRRSGEPR